MSLSYERWLDAATRVRSPESTPSPAPVVQLFTRPQHVKSCMRCGYVGGNARGCGTAHTTQPGARDEREPHIKSVRGPRYVDHGMCPMCGTDGEGIAYQGELMSGAKVHTLQVHSVGLRCSRADAPRCLGSEMRMVFINGVWIGAPT